MFCGLGIGNRANLAYTGRPAGLTGENLAVMAMLPMQTSPDVGGGDFGSMTLGRRSKKEERIPQWGYQETKEFIAARAELEKDFSQTKRNKTLWQLIAGKMKEKGFHRSADQCKCKWKNLVNRYKVGCVSVLFLAQSRRSLDCIYSFQNPSCPHSLHKVNVFGGNWRVQWL